MNECYNKIIFMGTIKYVQEKFLNTDFVLHIEMYIELKNQFTKNSMHTFPMSSSC